MTLTHRLFYEDNNNNLVTVADIDDSTDRPKLQNARLKFRNQAVDKLVCWENSQSNQLFGSLPIKKSSFAASEPELYWQEQRNRLNIVSVNTTNDNFTVSGDHTEDFREGGAVKVEGSTGNDGDYTVADFSSVTYDSNADETTINVEQNVADGTADGTIELWENIFRGYLESQGVILENGEHKFTLYDHSKYTGKQQASISTAVTTDIVDAMDQALPNSYTLDTPASSSVEYVDANGNTVTGYPPIDSYTNTGRRTTSYRELTKRYGWALKFRADKTIRFEPIGFGGTVDTIEGPADFDPANNSSRGSFKEWSKERLESIKYTQVQVIGKDGNGSEVVSDIKENTTLVNDYGEIFQLFKVDFTLGGKTEADRIANNIVKDVQNPTEGGKINVKPRYHTNTSNDSFQITDSQRGIDAVFTCTQQINFYPENKTGLQFQFETEVEKKAENYEGLRSERSRLYPGGETSVNFNDFGAENSDTTADVSATEDNQSPDVDGSTDTSNQTADYNYNFAGPASFSGTFNVSTTVPTSSFNDIGMYIITVNVQIQNANSGNSSDNSFDLEISNTTTGSILFNEDNINIAFATDTTSACRTFTIIETGNDSGDTIQAEISNYSGGALIDITVDAIEEHDHDGQGTNGDLAAQSHNHNVSASDAGHGSPSSGLEHVITAQQAEQFIDALQEIVEDR